jgi:hypothetical protein
VNAAGEVESMKRPPHIRGKEMVTADEVKEEAMSLARTGLGHGEAISLLMARADRRVSVVMAKRMLEAQLEDDPSDGAAAEALKLVEGVLQGGDWAE